MKYPRSAGRPSGALPYSQPRGDEVPHGIRAAPQISQCNRSASVSGGPAPSTSQNSATSDVISRAASGSGVFGRVAEGGGRSPGSSPQGGASGSSSGSAPRRPVTVPRSAPKPHSPVNVLSVSNRSA